ncbi:Myb-like, SWIRM and MPN domains 1 [Apophysomyces sp. BC1015]|nr:Myb-like, SWIRM and MPN domains 1 [Apophysomyces sp. BC1015]KAG0174023.1 Myb-like, SWIRM and MPN domains 1 [Apophysomyces sp. BC1021]
MEDNEEIIDIGEEDSINSPTSSEKLLTRIFHLRRSSPITSLPAADPTDSQNWGYNEFNLRGVDEDSRALIEQMLAEEQYYYGVDTLSSISSPNDIKRKNKGNDGIKKKGIKKFKVQTDQAGDEPFQPKKIQKKGDDIISSASLPSHKTRWTVEEDDLLRAALEKHGYGNWKVISEDIKTRNPLQCKNHARHWMLSNKLDGIGRPIKGTEEDTKPIVRSADDKDDEEMISVEDDGSTIAEDIPSDVDESATEEKIVKEIESKSREVSPKKEESDQSNCASEENQSCLGDDTVSFICINSKPVTTDEMDSQELATPPIDDDKEIPKEEEVLSAELPPVPIIAQTSDDNIPKPSDDALQSEKNDSPQMIQAVTDERLDRFVISEEERLENSEWFNNKQSKTPDRYLKIRNHILDCWNACRPRYLTKTSARKGLRDCGDVNAIGRVHTYLEVIGAINVDCVTNAPRLPKRIAAEVYEDDDTSMFVAADMVIGYDGPRKRKVRNGMGEWVDPKELEGRVIEHGVVQETGQAPRPKRVIKRPQHYYGGDDFGRGYDPFRLVPLEHYGDEYPAPFTVEIASDALLVIDFHSHLAHTEIIGLLGGNYIDSDNTKVLKVECVFPCRSTSTGIQCEMDPTSEMRAREVFAERGFNVVGWYHSHPTFEPQPSIRDIENQTSYQTLFRNEKTGDEPFIGMIVTPYDEEIVSDHSIFQYLHISDHWNESRSFRVPYACRRLVKQSEQVSPEVMEQMSELVQEYKGYEHKVDMRCSFRQQTRLDKLLDSLRANLFLVPECTISFLDKVRDMMLQQFVDVTNGLDNDTNEEQPL